MSIDPMGGWVQIYIDDNRREVESFVRAWVPGDGLECSSRRGVSRTTCGKPVAVVVTRQVEDYVDGLRRNGQRYAIKPPRTRMCCAVHLTSLFSGAFYLDRTKAEQAAQQEICAKYRSQYEKARDRKIAEMKAERLNEIPAAVRALVAAEIDNGTIWSTSEGVES